MSIVKGHEIDIARFGIFEMGLHLARIGKDDSRGGDAASQDLLDFGFGSTIETGAEIGQQTDDRRIWVAFDGKEWLDTGKISGPFFMFPDDAAKIDGVEGLGFNNDFIVDLLPEKLGNGLVVVSWMKSLLYIVFMDQIPRDRGDVNG